MKRYVAMFVVLAFAAAVVLAEEKAAADVTITLKGKIDKSEKKEGAEVKYTLVTADAKVKLPKKTGDIKLEEFVGADVEMVVKGTEKEKDGKVKVTVKEIVSIKKADVQVAEASKAEAPKVDEKAK